MTARLNAGESTVDAGVPRSGNAKMVQGDIRPLPELSKRSAVKFKEASVDKQSEEQFRGLQRAVWTIILVSVTISGIWIVLGAMGLL